MAPCPNPSQIACALMESSGRSFGTAPVDSTSLTTTGYLPEDDDHYWDRMESNQQTEQPATDPQNNADLWVLEGVIDAPLVLPRPGAGPNQGKDVRGFSIDFGSGDGDGFVEFHAADVERANKPEWWSKDAPVLFDFRCSVVAAEPLVAWLRANDFLAQVLDRLTFLTGDPVTLVSRSYLYNETELIECEAGRRSTFRFQTGGIPTSTTGPMRNLHVLARLRPSNRGKLAMRWFRKALTFEKEEDQFLAFFVALEVLSDDIKAAAKISPTCKNCGAPISSFTSHLEGVKDVVNRHSDLPLKCSTAYGKCGGKSLMENYPSHCSGT